MVLAVTTATSSSLAAGISRIVLHSDIVVLAYHNCQGVAVVTSAVY